MTLAAKIQTARTDADLTPAQLAILVGVTKRAVTMWENGERAPTFKFLQRIAEATDRPLQWFADEREEAKA